MRLVVFVLIWLVTAGCLAQSQAVSISVIEKRELSPNPIYLFGQCYVKILPHSIIDTLLYNLTY